MIVDRELIDSMCSESFTTSIPLSCEYESIVEAIVPRNNMVSTLQTKEQLSEEQKAGMQMFIRRRLKG